MSAVAAVAKDYLNDEIIVPPRFTANGRPEKVALETRSKLGGIIDELSDDDINQIAQSAEAHTQSGQRVFLEVAYGEPAGTTDAVLLFKKSNSHITAVYTLYRDEEEGRDKRLLRELKRMEYLEKVVMRQLETIDRNNSIGVVQGMLRSSGAFVKGLQSVFKQVETLSKLIERGLQHKSEMPTAEQKTAAIQAIQTTLSKLQPTAANHLAIKNMAQQQVDLLLKNVAMPVANMQSNVKTSAAPLSPINSKNNTGTPNVTAPRADNPKTASASPLQSNVLQSTALQTNAQIRSITLQSRTPETARPITSIRFSVLTNPNITERVHARVASQPQGTKAIFVETSRPVPHPSTLPIQMQQAPVQQASAQQIVPTRQANVQAALAQVPTTLRVVIANPELQRTTPPVTRSFTIIDSKAEQQILSTLTLNTPVNAAQPVAVKQAQDTSARVVQAVNTAHTRNNQTIQVPTNRAEIVANRATVTEIKVAQAVSHVAEATRETSIPAAIPKGVPVAEQTARVIEVTNVQHVVSSPATEQAKSNPANVSINNNGSNNHAATSSTAEIKSVNPATQQIGLTQQQRALRVDPSRPAADSPAQTSQKQTEARQTGTERTEQAKLKLPGLDKSEKDETDARKAFKQEAKTACEACTHKNCGSCGVKSATILGTKDTHIPVSGKLSGAQVEEKEKKFAANAGPCVGCTGGKCAGCGVATVTADISKISSRFATLNKTPQNISQPSPK